jgi:DNA polymerase III subunit delta'
VIFLKDIFGQDSAIESLRAAYGGDRLPHGLIFAGPGGVGKGTTAGALGALFLCQKSPKLDACGKCDSCVAMSANAHPDFHVITKELARVHDRSGTSKATQLSIQVIRAELAVPAGRKTTLGQGKVFVVEEAELMTTAAQNALLKTLEEPWGRTLIILLTDSAGNLLPTIRSRCQTIGFGPLETKSIEKELRQRGIGAEMASAAAELGDGSLGGAIEYLENGVIEPAKMVREGIDAIVNGKRSQGLADLLKQSAEEQAKKTLDRDELASKDAALRGGLSIYLWVAARQLREHLLGENDPDTLETICRAVDAIARAEKYLEGNVNFSLVLEQLGLTLAAGTPV